MTRRRMLTAFALFGVALFMLTACAEMGPPSPPAATGASPAPPIYYANIAGLPVRKGPSSSAPEISTLQFNNEVQLLETKDGWGHVVDVSRNIEGWTAMHYLQPDPAQWPRQLWRQARTVSQRPALKPSGNPPQPAGAPVAKVAEAAPSAPIYYANIAGLPIRKGPSSSDPKISTLQFNDEVQLLETKDGWGHVVDVSRNIEGWTAMHYLQPDPAQWPRQLWRQANPAPRRPALKPSGNPPQPAGAPVAKVAEAAPSAPIYYANIAGLPIRKGPSSSDPEISTLQFNDEVQLLETKDGWGHVVDVSRNIEGWTAKHYLQPDPAQWPRQLWR